MIGILKRPIVTEKMTLLQEKGQYAFEVDIAANKIDIARAVEKKDLGTYGHSMRVTALAGRIAARLGLTEAEQHDLATAALLHDIGKIGISDAILGKPGKLSSSEMSRALGPPPISWLAPGLSETLETPDNLRAAGIKYIADWVHDGGRANGEFGSAVSTAGVVTTGSPSDRSQPTRPLSAWILMIVQS